MPKSAQQKFNEYLDECHQTSDAVSALEKAVQEKYDNHGYAYLAGYFMMQFKDVVSELPKAKRAEVRERILREATRFEQENLINKIKEAV